MHVGKRLKDGRRLAFYLVAVFIVLAVIGASFGLMGYIDHKLRQGAEQQVVAFTQQAASKVADRISNVQNALRAFEVQTADPATLVPSLKGLRDQFGFAAAAFAGMDGTGLNADGAPFSVAHLGHEETALSQGKMSYSPTIVLKDGRSGRLAQRPLFIDGQQAGALYVQIPFDLFDMAQQVDMSDGRGCFLLFQSSSGEILVPSSESTETSIVGNATLYSFLQDASEVDAGPGQKGAVSPLAFAGDAGTGGISFLKDTVTTGQTGFIVSSVDGKPSYVCVVPVDRGGWYVCNVIPVENVRAESAMVLTAFQVVFGIVAICFVSVIALVFATYRRRMRENNLISKTRLYKAFSESLDLAVNLYCPSDVTVMPIVAKAARIMGYTFQEVMSDYGLVEKLHLSKEGVVLFDRLRAGEVSELIQGEFFVTHAKTGEERWVSYSASPLFYEGKQRILVVFRDVTSEKELQLSMKDAMIAAEVANKAKSEFLSRMSHEIRTPMNAIIGMLQIALLHVDDLQKTSESLRKIGASSNHLLNLINDVLDISKIESGKTVLNSEPFRLGNLVEHAIDFIAPQCEQKNQILEVVVPSQDEVFVADAVRLRQLLINLLSNAVKYTPEQGRVRLEVALRADTVAAYRCITFTVSDDGIGMADEFKERLFEPFVMEGRSNAQGTGLGMPIVKNIVTMMGGNIHVDTALNKGTTFVVVLNLRVAFDPERRALEESELAGTAWDRSLDVSGRSVGRPSSGATEVVPGGLYGVAKRVPGPPAPSEPEQARQATSAVVPVLEGLRVLLGEDNDLNAEIACELLQEAGLVVDWAENGQVALQKFDDSPCGFYDVVLMDVQMPLMDGYEATRRIRALDRDDAKSVPIIAMSANAFAEDVHASLESGMNAHLSKPIDIRRVLEAIATHTRRSRDGAGCKSGCCAAGIACDTEKSEVGESPFDAKG
ncbi:MAG: ATP-binding protein [Gordonibacter sp.]|uniref:ATP-binding protein n=2 Tax=Gordonibacter sp. TaxID=1968902 RepID=UPI002FC90F8A